MHIAILLSLVCISILIFLYILSIFSCHRRFNGNASKKMHDIELQDVNDDDNYGDDNPNAPIAQTCGINNVTPYECSSESDFDN